MRASLTRIKLMAKEYSISRREARLKEFGKTISLLRQYDWMNVLILDNK